jgi:hypothetical protein
MQCRKKKRDGSACQAQAVAGKKYCPFHADPSRAAELGRRGGHRRTVYRPENLEELAPPRTAADLRDLLAQCIIEIRQGKLDPKLGNSISYLGTGFLRAVEVADIQARLDLLETAQRRVAELACCVGQTAKD